MKSAPGDSYTGSTANGSFNQINGNVQQSHTHFHGISDFFRDRRSSIGFDRRGSREHDSRDSLGQTLETPEEIAVKLRRELSNDQASLVRSRRDRVTGTVEWFKELSAYQNWRNVHTRQPFLWISGGAGKGKTTLSIFLHDQLREICATSDDTHMICFFCSHEGESRGTALAIVRSLIGQLLPMEKFSQQLIRRLEQCETLDINDCEMLWSFFESLLHNPESGTVICLIDGLDECDKESARWIQKKLVGLYSREDKHCMCNIFKCILVSRDSEFLSHRLVGIDNASHVSLENDCSQYLQADIHRFVENRAQDIEGWLGFQQGFKDWFQESVLDRASAEASFLWLAEVMKEMEFDDTQEDVRQKLGNFPAKLVAVFDRILRAIPADHCDTVAKMLRWVATGKRPMTLLELADSLELACSSDSDDDNRKQKMRDRIKWSSGFLQETGDEKVIIADASRNEYLRRPELKDDQDLAQFYIDEEATHLEIAQKCLDYIKASHLQHKRLSEIPQIGEYPFLQYAVVHWTDHAREAEEKGEEIFQSARFVFRGPSDLQRNWWLSYTESGRLETWQRTDGVSPLHMACRFGLTQWVKAILGAHDSTTKPSLRALVNCCDDSGASPLAAAVVGGYTKLVSVLLQNCANVNATTALYPRTPLTLLASKAFNSFCNQMSDKDYMWTSDHTVLYRAAYKGHLDVVKLLLSEEHGVDPTATGFRSSSVLHGAAIGGNKEVLELLLKSRAGNYVNRGLWPNGTTPLHHAARASRPKSIEILIKNGAKVDAQKVSSKATPLHYAADANATTATFRALLDHGADVNARRYTATSETTPLHILVTRSPRLDTLRLLIDRGADVNAKDKQGRTPLDLCTLDGRDAGRFATAELLEKAGAEFHNPSEKAKKLYPELFGLPLAPLKKASSLKDYFKASDGGAGLSEEARVEETGRAVVDDTLSQDLVGMSATEAAASG